MRAYVIGEVVRTEVRSYQGKQGEGSNLVIYVRQAEDDLAYGATKVEAPLDTNVEVGQHVSILASIRERAGQRADGTVWSMLNVWATKVEAYAPASAAV